MALTDTTHLRALALTWIARHSLELGLRLCLGLRAGDPVCNGQPGDTARFDGHGLRPGGETGLGLARYLVGEGYLRAHQTGGPGRLGLGPVLLTQKGAQQLVQAGHPYRNDTQLTELETLGPARMILHWHPVNDHGHSYRPGRLNLQVHVHVAGRDFHVRASTDARLSEQLRAFMTTQLTGADEATQQEMEAALEAATQLRGRYPTPMNAQATADLIPESVWRRIREMNSELAVRRAR